MKQETAQHDKLIEELLHSTEKMKKNSLQITNQMALDEEIMKQVHETVDHVSDSVASTNKDLKTVTNERIGWRAYIWLIKIVVIFILVRAIFL